MTAVSRVIDKTSRAPQTFLAAESVTGADSAANAEAGSITVPAGERWLLKSVTVPLVQGLTQTPWPRLIITDGTQTIFAAHSGTAAQAVSTTCQHCWSAGNLPVGPTGATTAVVAQGALPQDMILEAGSVISTSTVGLGANSDYGKLVARVIKLPV